MKQTMAQRFYVTVQTVAVAMMALWALSWVTYWSRMVWRWLTAGV